MKIVGLQGSAVSVGQLTGTIVPKGRLQGTLVPKGRLVGTVCMPNTFDVYTGKYSVTPSMDEQTLATKDKRMTSDVVVIPIPVHEISNEHGVTVIIGGDLDVQIQE